MLFLPWPSCFIISGADNGGQGAPAGYSPCGCQEIDTPTKATGLSALDDAPDVVLNAEDRGEAYRPAPST